MNFRKQPERLLLLVFLLGFFVSCQKADKSQNDHLLMATLWMQQSAEYKALCYQTYHYATMTLAENLKNHQGDKKPAVVLDLDETVLDNSPFEAWTIKSGEGYPKGWQEWCDLGKAELIPGAFEFLEFAEKNRVEIFYISNRRESTRAGTIKNLQYRNLPNAQDKYVLLRTDESTKEPRRQQVLKEYDILLLLGDNLLDFSTLFEDQGKGRRNDMVDSLRTEFGTRFVVLPNPAYGAWDSDILNYEFDLTHDQKIEARKKALEAFDF